MRCKKCGKTLNSKTDKKICSYCGTKVPPQSKTDITTIILAAVTLILFTVFIYVVYDRFLEDKIKDKKDKVSPTPSYSDTSTTTGNTSGNLSNGGIVAESEDFIYYAVINKKLETSLYKRSKDNNEEATKVIDEECKNISVMSNAIYYTNSNDKLCRIALSGKDQGLVKTIGQNGAYKYVTVVGDWIYYCDSNNKLHKMRPFGETITALSEGEFKNITVVGDKVYGINNDGFIVHVGTDGKKEKKTDIKANEIVSTTSWLYFTDGTNIYRALPSSLSKEKIAEVNASNLNVYDNLIYYFDNDANKVFKMNVEGEEKTEVIEFNAKSIYVVEDSIFLLGADDNLMYEYKEEGSKLELIQ